MAETEKTLCPSVEAAFALLAKKWTGLIILSLREGELSFNRLAQSVPGLSARLLALRLRELEESGIVRREVKAEIPPLRVGYSLTARGIPLAAILREVAGWAND